LQQTIGNRAVGRLLQKGLSVAPREQQASALVEHDRENPVALRAKLNQGHPLDSRTRTRMENTFGTGFSDVRVHTDYIATNLSADLKAHAFTIGNDVAFGRNRYRPGTLLGDALLAHELAHVIQQRGGDSQQANGVATARSPTDHLEQDARSSTIHAALGLWGKATDMIGTIAQNALPRLRTGLQLQRCGFISSLFEDEDAEQVSSPAPTPLPAAETEEQAVARDHEADRAAVAAHLRTVLSDNQLGPADWRTIRQQARAHHIDANDLESILSFTLDFDAPYDEAIATIALSENSTIQQFSTSYTTRLTGSPPRLVVDPVSELITQILADGRIERAEFEALRSFNWTFDATAIRTALAASNVDDPTLSSLLSLTSLGYTDLRTLSAMPDLFPIQLRAGETGGLQSTTDLRHTLFGVITADGVWQHLDFRIVRSLLGGMNRAAAATFLQSAGYEPVSAGLIAGEFTRSERSYRSQVEERRNLTLTFQRNGEQWALTTASRENLALPWHPTLVQPLAPVREGADTRVAPTMSTTVASHTFASGRTTRADQLTYQFGRYTFTLILSEDLYEDDTLFFRVEDALSVIPDAHLRLLRRLILDPGNDPGGTAIANAARDGTVNIYFSGAGPRVPQRRLNATTAHEFGHLVSFQAEDNQENFWDSWEQAMDDDPIGISRYGFTNKLEDFAEAYVLYLSGGRTERAVRARYSHRFRILDTLF